MTLGQLTSPRGRQEGLEPRRPAGLESRGPGSTGHHRRTRCTFLAWFTHCGHTTAFQSPFATSKPKNQPKWERVQLGEKQPPGGREGATVPELLCFQIFPTHRSTSEWEQSPRLSCKRPQCQEQGDRTTGAGWAAPRMRKGDSAEAARRRRGLEAHQRFSGHLCATGPRTPAREGGSQGVSHGPAAEQAAREPGADPREAHPGHSVQRTRTQGV